MEGQNFTPPPTPGAPVSPQPDPRSIGEILRDSMAKDPEATRAALAAMAAPQPEPAGAGVDLTKEIEAVRKFISRAKCYYLEGSKHKARESVTDMAEWGLSRIQHYTIGPGALRSPASPPRDLEAVRKALESALAGVWDGHYSGTGVTVGYAQAVDAEVKAALKILDAAPAPEETPAPGTAEPLDLGAKWVDLRVAGAVFNSFRSRDEIKQYGMAVIGECERLRKEIERLRAAPGTPIEKAARAAIEASREALDWFWNEDGKHTGEGREEMDDLLRYIKALEATLDGSGPTEGMAA